MSPSPRPAQAGFSLLEVMVAMVILSIGIASMFGAMGTAGQVSERARYRDLALQSVEEIVERIRPTAFSNIDAFDDYWFDVPGLGAPTGRQQVGHVRFDNESGSQVTMEITTEWVDQQGPASLNCWYIAAQR